MNQNFYNDQRSGPSREQGEGASSGRPRYQRPRDVYRMAERREKRAFQNGDWSEIMEAEERSQNARDNLYTNKKKNNNKWKPKGDNKPKPQPTPESMLSKTETPPSDEAMYDGGFRGGRPIVKTVSHNIDLSGYPLLCRTVWDTMAREDDRLARTLPFPMFLHSMTVIANAYLLDYAKFTNRNALLQQMANPLDMIGAAETYIPKPIYDYLCSIGTALSQTNESIFVNYPSIAIPQGPIGETASGTFGIPGPENHNVYECYLSPFVTRRYIEETILVNTGQGCDQDWNPFPEDWLPEDVTINSNLNGYFPIERLHRDAIMRLERCDFSNDDSIVGRLCFSAYAQAQVSQILQLNAQKVELKMCDFKYKENSSIFIFKELNTEIASSDHLADVIADLKCPYSFGASSANKQNYYGLKRSRTEASPGCFATVFEDFIEGWVETRNSNFNMEGDFAPIRQYRDRPSLRIPEYVEDGSEGFVSLELSQWLLRHFKKRGTLR